MGSIDYILGTLSAIFQIGRRGPKIKHNTGVVEFRDAADAAFAKARFADPVGADDGVTKRHFDANLGAGLKYVSVPILLIDVVSDDVIPNNAIIFDTRLVVGTGYDVGTTIDVTRTGDPTANPMTVAQNDAEVMGEYRVPSITPWGSTGLGTVTVTIAGGPAAGAATLYIGYALPVDIS